MSRVLNLYRTQIELLWHWRLGRLALLKRAVVAVVASVIAFNLTAWLLPGHLQIEALGGGLLAVLFISALNLLVRPVLLALVATRSIVALVLLTLLFQALVIWLLTPLVPGVDVSTGLLGALIISFVFGFLVAAISTLFGLGEDDSYYGTLVRTLATRRPDVTHTDEPGLVIIQVDGLSHDVASHALRAGRIPTMARWLRSGSHRLAHWDALLPSTTPASQAGILHGNNDGIPNFRWWEKESGQLLVANHPEDATVIEQRISNGEGLLSPGGSSISNIFTGDGDRAFLVMSTIKVKERGLGQSDAFAWFFVSPYNYLTMGAKYLGEVVKERYQAIRQERAGIEPRMHRGFPYPAVRAATNVALRSLGTSLVIQEMLRGAPVIYMDYTDYDEIAHHSGPERPEALDALDGVDRQLRTLQKAVADAPRPYRFVILADHGQSLGATFLQRYGVTIEEVIRTLMGGHASMAAATEQVEDWGQLNTFLGEVSETRGVSGSVARAMTRDRGDGADGDLGPDAMRFTAEDQAARSAPLPRSDGPPAAAPAEVADLVVVAGGNLALAYFNDHPGRMSHEELQEHYPGLVEGLVAHPGIGIVMARSSAHGALAIGRDGVHYLDDGRIVGADPLVSYGERAAEALRRLDAIDHVGDLALISLYEPETGEIAAFEELIGAHGGLGGAQTRPFMLYPADWELDLAPLIGAPMVYRQLRRWMEDELGFVFGPRPGAAEAAGADTAERSLDTNT